MATRTWFSFGDRGLHYRVRDNSGDVEFSVDYTAIPASSRLVFDRNNWLRNVGFIWCALGVFQLGLTAVSGEFLIGAPFWFLLGAGCLAFYRFTWTTYTVFDTEDSRIFILHGKQHDEIVDAIHARRKSHLIAMYRGLNFDNNPDGEIKTIEWLVKEEVLTSAEAKARIAEIRASEAKLQSQDDTEDTDPKLH